MERLRIQIQGLERPVRRLGEGPPLLCLNGLTQTTANWTGFARRIAEQGYQCLLTDLPGQGSVPPMIPGGPAQQAQVLPDLLDALELTKVHVLGFSFGGRVALELMRQSPERLGRVVLVSASLRPSRAAKLVAQSWLRALDEGGMEALAREALPWIIGDQLLAGDLDLLVRTTSRRNQPAGIRSLLTGMLEHPNPDLSQLALPALVVAGQRDRFALAVDQRWGSERLPNSSYQEVPEVGHAVPVEATDALVLAVADFLGQG